MRYLIYLIAFASISFFAAGCTLNQELVQAPPPNPNQELQSRASANPGLAETQALIPTTEIIILESDEPTPQSIPNTPFPNSLSEQKLPIMRQLTRDGCCVNPFWSADSARVLFIDRPSQDAPAGIWAVDLQGNEPKFVTDRLGIFSHKQLLRAFPLEGQTLIEDLTNDQRWVIPNGGREIVFSTDDNQVAWTTGRTQPPFDTAERQVWIGNVDGSAPRQVFSAYSAGVISWFPNGHLLVSGRKPPPESLQTYWKLSPPDDSQGNWEALELASGPRLRGASVSPGGDWLAYTSVFSGDPALDGVWLLNLNSLDRYKLNLFGAYRWQDANHLLMIPLDPNQTAHHILQIQANSQTIQQLTLPGVQPFKVSNGDWSVSPDGKKVVFVSAWDGNIWLIEF